MKRKHHTGSIIVLVLACLTLTGEMLVAGGTDQNTELTLPYALGLATTQSTGLEGNRLDMTAALRRAQASWTSYLPSISIVTSARATGSLVSLTGGVSSSASLGVSLSFNGTNTVNEKILQSAYGGSLVAYDQAYSALVVEVSKAYWSLVARQESLDVLQDNLLVVQQQYQKSQQGYEAGLVPELDVLKTLIALRSAENALQAEENSYDEAFSTFKVLLGIEVESPYAIADTIEPQQLALPSVGDLASLYTEQRYDVQLLRLAVKQASLSLSEKKISTFTPSVTLSGGWDLGLSSTASISDTASFSVAVSIPVSGYIPGSDSSLNLLDSSDAVSKAQVALSSGLLAAYADIQTKAVAIGRLWRAIETQILNLDILTQAYALSQDAYNSGLLSITELNESRQGALEASKTLVEARLSYVLASYDLAFALGIDVDKLYALYGSESDMQAESK